MSGDSPQASVSDVGENRRRRLLAPAAAALAAAALLAAGCGGAGPGPACDDAAFRNQSEELYVAIATAQNVAAASPPTPALLDDLRKGVGVLSDHVEAHPPCTEELQELAEREREAIGLLESALARSGQGEDATSDLTAAIELLGDVEVALR